MSSALEYLHFKIRQNCALNDLRISLDAIKEEANLEAHCDPIKPRNITRFTVCSRNGCLNVQATEVADPSDFNPLGISDPSEANFTPDGEIEVIEEDLVSPRTMAVTLRAALEIFAEFDQFGEAFVDSGHPRRISFPKSANLERFFFGTVGDDGKVVLPGYQDVLEGLRLRIH